MKEDIKLAKAIEELEHMLQVTIRNLYIAGRLGDAELIYSHSLSQNILIGRLTKIIGEARVSRTVGRIYAEIDLLAERNGEIE